MLKPPSNVPCLDLGQGLVICLETVSPFRANEILEFSARDFQRADRHRVELYARMMKVGEFMLTVNSPVMIKSDFTLSNGLHRLLAVIESDTPTPLLVAYGC